MSEPVTVGEMLIYREETDRTLRNVDLSSAARKRGEFMLRMIDELIERRQKESAARG